MKTTIVKNKVNLVIEALTVGEAHEAGYLTYSEYLDHSNWVKSKNAPIEDKFFIYVNGTFAAIINGNEPTEEQVVMAASDTIEFLS